MEVGGNRKLGQLGNISGPVANLTYCITSSLSFTVTANEVCRETQVESSVNINRTKRLSSLPQINSHINSTTVETAGHTHYSRECTLSIISKIYHCIQLVKYKNNLSVIEMQLS